MKTIYFKTLLLMLGLVATGLYGQNDKRKVERKVVIIRGGPVDTSVHAPMKQDSLKMTLEEYARYLEKWLDSNKNIIVILPKPPLPPSLDFPDTIYIPEKPYGYEEISMEDLPPPPIPDLIASSEFNLGFTKPGTSNFNDVVGFPDLSNGRSVHVGLGQSWGLNLIRGKLRLWFGLHYDINSYRFKQNDVKLDPNTPAFAYSNTGLQNAEKSKLVVNYLGIPIALGYQANGWDAENGIHVRAGVNAGYLVRSHSKIKNTDGEKNKQFDDFHFNNFAITPFLYLSYNSFGLYAKYTLTPMFNEGEGPLGNTLQFGVLIN